jgi:hypothetical protein
MKNTARLPEVSAHIPEVLTHIPEVLTHIPEVLAHMPEVLAHMPKVLAHMPEVLAHMPKVLANKDGSTGKKYLVSNNWELSTEEFKTCYKKRWSVEEYHKSLKQNVAAAKSPARTVTTQNNHLFASLAAYVKWEKLKFAHKLNHFALKAKIDWATSKPAWSELAKIKIASLKIRTCEYFSSKKSGF